ncbi:MAG: NADH-quinone oxidoreductase subunit A [Candidatus Hatepunaea meridiana]|nr:NADH-quinone oxidoreductase subunit A [Candidatus Hatepunaea meridiana]
MSNYIPVLIFMFVALGLTGLMMAMVIFLGPKRTNPAKEEPFETGNPPTQGDARARFPVHFYLVAILFVVFDIEIAFMYPWAVQFKQLGMLGLVEMFVFVFILMFGWFYIIKRGVLGWK